MDNYEKNIYNKLNNNIAYTQYIHSQNNNSYQQINENIYNKLLHDFQTYNNR